MIHFRKTLHIVFYIQIMGNIQISNSNNMIRPSWPNKMRVVKFPTDSCLKYLFFSTSNPWILLIHYILMWVSNSVLSIEGMSIRNLCKWKKRFDKKRQKHLMYLALSFLLKLKTEVLKLYNWIENFGDIIISNRKCCYKINREFV